MATRGPATTGALPASINAKSVFVWMSALFLFVILADYYPRVTKWLVVLLLLSVLLIHYKDYVSIVNGAFVQTPQQKAGTF